MRIQSAHERRRAERRGVAQTRRIDWVHRLGSPSSGTLYRSFQILPANGGGPVRLGTRDAAVRGSAANSYLIGALDEIAIYPRMLSADEILENYTTATTTSA